MCIMLLGWTISTPNVKDADLSVPGSQGQWNHITLVERQHSSILPRRPTFENVNTNNILPSDNIWHHITKPQRCHVHMYRVHTLLSTLYTRTSHVRGSRTRYVSTYQFYKKLQFDFSDQQATAVCICDHSASDNRRERTIFQLDRSLAYCISFVYLSFIGSCLSRIGIVFNAFIYQNAA